MCALCVGACMAHSRREVRYNGVVNQTEGKDNEQQQPAQQRQQVARRARNGVVCFYVGSRNRNRAMAYPAAFRPWHLVGLERPKAGRFFLFRSRASC